MVPMPEPIRLVHRPSADRVVPSFGTGVKRQVDDRSETLSLRGFVALRSVVD